MQKIVKPIVFNLDNPHDKALYDYCMSQATSKSTIGKETTNFSGWAKKALTSYMDMKVYNYGVHPSHKQTDHLSTAPDHISSSHPINITNQSNSHEQLDMDDFL
ncbi:hypothetical protein DFP93_101222 [Aneurinibacillus soli]|uniref:Uncharacterized protein n=1 Tax=Aneurinibacillus soli TaxID=1500254 RepID=A0A0U5B0N4_9BACL|nr:hypothetical protein [Aneurinibacillus soli]PYE64197.1 hypothetical protein DFP93_101222 [Aneurinibacillus soli]BAU28146.1 hypothetical protein CB4_02320 [Aneurinibacillus soli]